MRISAPRHPVARYNLTATALAVVFLIFGSGRREAEGPASAIPPAKGTEAAIAEPGLAELADLLAIPNVASDTPNIRRNAKRLAAMMPQRGLDVRLVEVEGRRRSSTASDPWTPVLRSGRLEDGAPVVPLDRLAAGPEGDEWRLYQALAFFDYWLDHQLWVPLTTNIAESGFSRVVNRIKRVGRRWSERGLINWLRIAFRKIFQPNQRTSLWRQYLRLHRRLRLVSLRLEYQWVNAIT